MPPSPNSKSGGLPPGRLAPNRGGARPSAAPAKTSPRTARAIALPVLPASARLDQRLIAPLRQSRRARAAFAGALGIVLAAHLALLALFLTRDRVPAQIPKEETPIEIVVEKKEPPPAPMKRPDPPQPQPKQAIEKPASSAPRAPNEQKVDTAALDKDIHAPQAAKPPSEGRPQPQPDAASPAPDPAKSVEPDNAGKPDEPAKDAEALDKARPKETPKKIVKATPKARQRKPVDALAQLAGASSLPDYSFARPAKKAPVSGGTEDARYLAIVYGMIMQSRRPVALPGDVAGSVTIAFTVDDVGNVVGIGIHRRSGYPEADDEILDAVRRASPFPPPPPGAPHGLVATIEFGDMKPAYTMGGRGR